MQLTKEAPGLKLSNALPSRGQPLSASLPQRRETGNVLPRPIPGRPKVKGKALEAQLARQLEAYPGATLADHCQIWETEQGMQVSLSTMSRAIHAMGWERTPALDRNQNVP